MRDIFAQMAEPMGDGSWVNSRIARIVEIIKEYDPMLEVRWLPRDKRIDGADAFQIVDNRINRVAFSVKDEASFDETVLARIFESDMAAHSNSPLTMGQKIDALNTATKLLKLKTQNEEDEDRNDKITTILKSPMNAYTHDGYRFDKHPSDQPKVGIFDVSVGHKTSSEAPIRGRGGSPT